MTVEGISGPSSILRMMIVCGIWPLQIHGSLLMVSKLPEPGMRMTPGSDPWTRRARPMLRILGKKAVPPIPYEDPMRSAVTPLIGNLDL